MYLYYDLVKKFFVRELGEFNMEWGMIIDENNRLVSVFENVYGILMRSVIRIFSFFFLKREGLVYIIIFGF